MNYIGIAYPFKSGIKGLFDVKENEKLIEGNIIQILGTRKGERVMLPEFGSNIHRFIHEPLDSVTCALLRTEIFDAIKKWEPRVVLNRESSALIAYPEEHLIKVKLHYRLKVFNQDRELILNINEKGVIKDRWLV